MRYGAAMPMMRMRRAPVCSTAYSPTRLKRAGTGRAAHPRAASGAMCGSTHWPSGGFSIIRLSRRPAAKHVARAVGIEKRLKKPGAVLEHRDCSRPAGRPSPRRAHTIDYRMRANVCRFIDFLARRRSVIRIPPCRRTGTTRAYLLLRVAGRVGSAGATGRAPCMPSMLRCAMKRTTRQVAPRRCAVTSLRRCNDRVRFAGIRCDISVSRDAGDYRRLKNTARFLHAISFRIVGNEQYPSCRKVVFATD